MFSAITRIMLALALAIVFTGRMEAAAAHCASLAREEPAQTSPTAADEPSCHGMETMAPAHHAAASETPDQPQPDHCDCIAALKVCAAPAMTPGSARITPYAFLPPESARFASIDPAPGLRPPRA